MSCSQIREMTTKLVPANILEQVREANAQRESGELNPPINEADEDDDADLKMALKMSLETHVEDNGEPDYQRTTTIHMNVVTKLLQDIELSLHGDLLVPITHPIPVI